jgi:hypothetical protein
MPFKSEKQRRYLWANEPQVARRWTDKYGSEVVKRAAKKKGQNPDEWRRKAKKRKAKRKNP